MLQSELKHSLAVSRDSWFIRFYLWNWGAEPEDINFCKLFWAYVFFWLPFILKPLIFLVVRLEKRGEARRDARRVEIRASLDNPQKKKKESRLLAVLSGIAELFSKLSFSAASLIGKHPWVGRTAYYGVYVVAGLLSLAVLGVIVWAAVSDPLVAAAVVGCFILVGISIVIVRLLERAGFWSWLGRKLKGADGTFRSAMRVGYYAVKTNTCPRIELK